VPGTAECFGCALDADATRTVPFDGRLALLPAMAMNRDVRPVALQVALAIPILAGLLGVADALRMLPLRLG
jgi:hypothetical protein